MGRAGSGDGERRGRQSRRTGAGRLVSGDPGLEPVVLNGCDTARPGSVSQPVAGAAAGLMLAGLPAVVAMQHRISDQAAILFTEAFYTTLARGAGIEEAVIEGRMAIHLQDRRSLEWITRPCSCGAARGWQRSERSRSNARGRRKKGSGPQARRRLRRRRFARVSPSDGTPRTCGSSETRRPVCRGLGLMAGPEQTDEVVVSDGGGRTSTDSSDRGGSAGVTFVQAEKTASTGERGNQQGADKSDSAQLQREPDEGTNGAVTVAPDPKAERSEERSSSEVGEGSDDTESRVKADTKKSIRKRRRVMSKTAF